MKLTINQCSALFAAHKELDGYNRVVKEGETERSVRQSYVLPFAIQLAVAENMEALEKVLKLYEKNRQELFRQHANGEDFLTAGSPELIAYAKAIDDLTVSEIEVELQLLDFKQLDNANNSFPPSALSKLLLLRKPE